MMGRKLSDSVVVITGASSGIGKATAIEFATEGAKLVLAARRQEALEDTAEECRREGATAIVVPTDVADEEQVRALARSAVDHFGRIDVWVNNAAVSMFSRIEEAPIDQYRHVLETNLFGYIYGARCSIPYFREQGSGTLINVSSVVGKISQPFTSAYCISKFGIVGLSESLRMELQDAPGIQVSTILPASIDTPIFQNAANYTGRAVKPMSPIYPAEQVARAIVKCAKHPKREVIVGKAGRVMNAMHNIAPGLTEKRFAKTVNTDHFQEHSAEYSGGNIMHPSDEYRSIDGGWRNKENRPKKKTAIGAGAGIGLLVGGAALAWWMMSGRENGSRKKSRTQELADRLPSMKKEKGRALTDNLPSMKELKKMSKKRTLGKVAVVNQFPFVERRQVARNRLSALLGSR